LNSNRGRHLSSSSRAGQNRLGRHRFRRCHSNTQLASTARATGRRFRRGRQRRTARPLSAECLPRGFSRPWRAHGTPPARKSRTRGKARAEGPSVARLPVEAEVARPREALRAPLGPRACHEAIRASLSSRIPSAELLKRVYDVHVLACPCGGQLRFIALILETEVAQRILDSLGVDSTPPPIARARSPDFSDGASSSWAATTSTCSALARLQTKGRTALADSAAPSWPASFGASSPPSCCSIRTARTRPTSGACALGVPRPRLPVRALLRLRDWVLRMAGAATSPAG